MFLGEIRNRNESVIGTFSFPLYAKSLKFVVCCVTLF